MADLEKSSSESETPEQDPREEPNEANEEATEPQNRRARRTAASQARKQRLREREEAEAVGLDAQEMIDDALVRSTDSAGKWFRNNSTWLQGVAVGGVALWAGWGLYGWQVASAQAKATAQVADAVAAERGRVGEPPAEVNPDFPDPTPQFKDDAERVAAAKKAFTLAAEERSGSGTSVYSKLALAALHLDEKKFDEAHAAYTAVNGDKLAASDPELRGRSLEGLAMVAEAKGDAAAANKAYADLEAAAISGFVGLAIYHQARLSKQLGDADAAKVLIEKLNKQLAEKGQLKTQDSYLGQAAKALSQELGIVVEEAPPAAPGRITPEQLKALQEQMQRSIQDKVPTKKLPEGDPAPAAPTPGAGGASEK